MKRGEVRWDRFARPDKNRPVGILTRDAIIPHIGEVTVAPVTSAVRDIPSEVLLDETDGLPRECAVNCDHMQTVSKVKIGSLIATLSPAKLRELRGAIAFAIALNE